MAEANPFDHFDAPPVAASISTVVNPFDQFDAPAQTKGQIATDVLKSAGAGLAHGVMGLAGLPGNVDAIVGKGVRAIGNAIGLPEPPPDAGKPLLMPTSADIEGAVEKNIGKLHEPQTTAGKYAETIGEFAPAAVAGPGGIARKVLLGDVVPAVASEAAGQATEGSSIEPIARVAGAILGAAAPGAAGRLITPLPATAERQAAVATLRREGIEPTAGQVTGSKAAQYAEDMLGNAPGAGGKATQAQERVGDAFTGAVLRRVGENATRATPEVIDRAFTRIGQNFDDLASRNVMHADTRWWNDLTDAHDEYRTLVPESQRVPAVENLVRDLGDAAVNNHGIIDGATYQAARSRIDRMARGAKADPQLSGALRDIRDAMDNAMERTIAVANPSDLGAWQDARRQYRNMLVVEKAATGAGENAAQGIISPSQLRNATVQQARRAYARGQGDFADLARAGEAVLKPLPNSGTAQRMAAHAVPAFVGATLGGFSGEDGFSPQRAIEGAALLGAPALAGRAIMSRPMQRYLANQVLTRPLQQLQPGRSTLAQILATAPRSLGSPSSGLPQVANQ